ATHPAPARSCSRFAAMARTGPGRIPRAPSFRALRRRAAALAARTQGPPTTDLPADRDALGRGRRRSGGVPDARYRVAALAPGGDLDRPVDDARRRRGRLLDPDQASTSDPVY